jgi:hypothetical protein
LTWAAAAKSGGGGKERCSLRTLVMFCEPLGEDIVEARRERVWRTRS